MRRCVEKLPLACQAVASAKAGVLNRNRKTIAINYRCRDNNVEILMPKAEGTSNARRSWVGRVTPVRAIVSAGRGLPALPAPSALRGVVEAVVSTAAHLGLGSAPGSGAGDSECLRESRTFGQWN